MDVRIVPRLLPHLGEHRLALRIVIGRAAREHQLDRDVRPDQAVGANDPDRILEAIEPRHLEHDRPGRIDPETGEDPVDLLAPQRQVLLAPRIDARGDQVLGVGQRLGEGGQGEDAGVVGPHQIPEELPDRAMRPADVDVAAPDPRAAPGLDEAQEPGRLWVVDEDEVGRREPVAQPVRVLPVHLQIPLELAPRDLHGVALQAVVELLGRGEELRVARDRLPRGLDPQVALERDEARQDLRHPAALGRRVDVDDAGPGQGAGQLAQVIDHLAAGRLGVGLERGSHHPPASLGSSARHWAMRARISVSDQRWKSIAAIRSRQRSKAGPHRASQAEKSSTRSGGRRLPSTKWKKMLPVGSFGIRSASSAGVAAVSPVSRITSCEVRKWNSCPGAAAGT